MVSSASLGETLKRRIETSGYGGRPITGVDLQPVKYGIYPKGKQWLPRKHHFTFATQEFHAQAGAIIRQAKSNNSGLARTMGLITGPGEVR